MEFYNHQDRKREASPEPTDCTPHAVTPAKEFPTDRLPIAVGEFIQAHAQAIGCDPSFVAIPTFGSIARAVGNRRCIQLKQGWTEPSVFWGAIIGKSGTHKSPAMAAGTRHLQELQGKALMQYADAMQNYEQDRSCHERDYGEWKRGKDRTVPPPEPPREPTCERYVTSDATVEALAAILAGQHDGILSSNDELSRLFGGLNQYKGGKGSDAGHWLSFFNAAPVTFDRRTGSQRLLHIPRASVSIVGGIQPDILREAIGHEHLKDGLCARFLFAMPDPRPVRWTEATVPHAIGARFGSVLEQLLALEPFADGDGRAHPIALTLTEEAKAVWVDYFNRHREELPHLSDDLAAAWTKLEAITARFAMWFQLCEWADTTSLWRDDSAVVSASAVDESAISAAIKVSEWFGNEAKRVYGLFSETSEQRASRELKDTIKKQGGSITPRELMRTCRHYQTSLQAELALGSLVKSGEGEWIHVPTTSKGGAPTRRFRLSKALTADATSEFAEVDGGSVNGHSHFEGVQ